MNVTFPFTQNTIDNLSTDIMSENIETSPPTVLILDELDYYDLPLFKLKEIKGINDYDLRIGELFNDTNIDDLIEMGFEIKINP